jgi:hypothetical protein
VWIEFNWLMASEGREISSQLGEGKFIKETSGPLFQAVS